jgi:hypothetical protein
MKSWGFAEQTFQLDQNALVEEVYIPEIWTNRTLNNPIYSIQIKYRYRGQKLRAENVYLPDRNLTETYKLYNNTMMSAYTINYYVVSVLK